MENGRKEHCTRVLSETTAFCGMRSIGRVSRLLDMSTYRSR